MEHLNSVWEAYRRKVLPSEVSETHLQLAKDAFYAGATWVIEEWKAPIMPPLPDDPGWYDRMREGLAEGDTPLDAKESNAQ